MSATLRALNFKPHFSKAQLSGLVFEGLAALFCTVLSLLLCPPIKTVYDPANYTDVQMASMANEAVGRAVYQWNAGGGVSSKEFVTVNGIKFEVPISSYKGQVYVPTAYPSGN